MAKHEKPSILSHRQKLDEIEVYSDQIGFFDAKYYRNDAFATDSCENLVLNGFDDWRLPTKEELNSKSKLWITR